MPGNIFALIARIQKGEVADVVIVGDDQIDDLIKANRVTAGSKMKIARIGAGVFVKKGASKSGICSVDAFKISMLAGS